MDNALARGVWMVLLWLGVLTALFVLIVAGIIWLTGVGPGDSGTSLYEGIWLAITRSLDPGTFSGDEGEKFRIGMLVVTLIGIFLGATIIGLESAEGTVSLNPGPARLIAPGDRVIGIAEDDSTFILDREPLPWSPPAELKVAPLPSQRERTLIIGWSGIAQLIVKEIETHVASGSELIVLVDPINHNATDVTNQLGDADLTRQIVNVRTGNTISRDALAGVLADGPYDHVLILCERALFDVEEADARVLLSLMHVRALDPGNARNVIAELVDPNDVELGRRGDSDEFIVSQQLISLLLAQLSESPHLVDVFADLFDGAGTAVALHPAERYVEAGETDFDAVIAEVRNWGVVAIGYRAAAAHGSPGALAGGIRVNPPKSERITFAAGDMIAVIVHTK
jgi:hypothetical protein